MDADNIQACSDFKAGELARSKLVSQKLDVSALFGGIYIHPLHLIDMNSDESLKYGIAALTGFLLMPLSSSCTILVQITLPFEV